jgi:CBS domain-containing protein
VHDVVTVRPDTNVAEAIKLLTEHDVSALPVLDPDGNLVGMLSEADLIHRVEIGTEKHRPWWVEAVTGASTLAEEFAKSHGKKVVEVMTTRCRFRVRGYPALRDCCSARAKRDQAGASRQ